jgi:uncharacterized membrane protein
MSFDMTILIAGLVLFLGIHLVPAAPAMREIWCQKLGDAGYKAVFSVASVVGLGLIIYGFSQRPYVPIWTPPDFARHITFLLMLPASILLAASQIPSRIRIWSRHPMLLAVEVWAFAHLLVNGDLAGMLLFGGFLAYAVYDMMSASQRGAFGPLGARSGGIGGDAAAVVIGLALYVFMLAWGHEHLIGIPLLRAVAIPS